MGAVRRSALRSRLHVSSHCSPARGARQATLGGREVPLSSYEFAIPYALATRAGRVLSREQLIELAGGSADASYDRSKLWNRVALIVSADRSEHRLPLFGA